jgi:diguanylate cyclase (GGDEF)-like protein/PAS domain S-box-containing protein
VAVGVALLAGAVLSTITAGRAAALSDLDDALSADAASHATALNEYFERAQSLDLLLAHDSAFQQFEPSLGRLSAQETAAASAQAGKALQYLERLYPGRISEACMIDSTGTELARVVRGQVAPASEMSTQEAKNPFFRPTMGLPRGHVYQAAPYLSPDSHEWVISNSTPLVTASGRPWGMVHFEVTLESFRPGDDEDGFSTRILDARNGRTLLESGQPLVGAVASFGRVGSPALRALVARPGANISATVDDRRVALARVPVQGDNANAWVVQAVAPAQAVGWFRSIGPAPIATSLAALLLLAFAGLNLRASHQAERRSEARYRALIDQSSDLVVVVDRDGRADFLSPSAERLLAPREDTASGGLAQNDPFDFVTAVDPKDRAHFTTALQAAVPGRMSGGEFRIGGKHGISTFEMTVQDLTADPSVGGLVLTGHDVTDRLALHLEMEHRALHDELTGLPNRALLFDRFEQALLGAERDGTNVGLLLLDLDRFKEVNDTFGHHYGDELLRQVGPRLGGVLRGVDTIARLGGDEFAVLLPDVHGVDDAANVAASLLAALAAPFKIEGVDMDVEASIGVVISGEHGTDAITLMQHADIAMYIAKTQHLGVFTYNPATDGHSATKLAMVGDLRRALDRHELVLYYQPKVSVTTGDLVGAEALVRWQHPEQGLVFPDAFIPLAERTGLIGPLTQYVLDAALTQARIWLDAGRPVPIAVNLSARNLHDEHFADKVAALLVAHDVPAALFELEVTESAIMIDPVRARQTLEHLSAIGCRLSIDDFGAGYTSLSQLTSMPISEIKIDRSFVMRMADDPSSALIVSSVVELGHNLGMTLVAEGVETKGNLTELAGLGCDVAQGYHLSRAIPADAFDLWSAGRPITPAPPQKVALRAGDPAA